ncbi:MAG TPA: ATP synthase F0 subunit B [Thermoanaerobaculia bacterium]|nr:ATP synthase F0 subunit B [Thermoanaerobaculia bacterium]
MQINLTPDLSLPAIMVIFFLNYLIVRKFFLKPINDVLEARETETTTADRLHEEALARFTSATADIESRLHTAKRDAAQVREHYRGEAAAQRQSMIDKTNADAKAVVADADEHLSRDVQAAREKIVSESESLAREAAQRILGRAV